MVIVATCFNIIAFITRIILIAFAAFLIIYCGALAICRHDKFVLPLVFAGIIVLLFEIFVYIPLVNFIFGVILICGMLWIFFEAIFTSEST